MGTIYYGGSETPINIEDRALAHLKVVIATKLRRGESFTVSWRHPEGQPRGRSTIWLHPSIPLRFVFDDPEPAVLNREWMDDLVKSANSSGGIMLVSEHFDVSQDAAEDENNVVIENVSVESADIDHAHVDEVTSSGSTSADRRSRRSEPQRSR